MVHKFRLAICPKLSVTARSEFELAYYDITAQNTSHYTTVTHFARSVT